MLTAEADKDLELGPNLCLQLYLESNQLTTREGATMDLEKTLSIIISSSVLTLNSTMSMSLVKVWILPPVRVVTLLSSSKSPCITLPIVVFTYARRLPLRFKLTGELMFTRME